jgi:hypothetical protein
MRDETMEMLERAGLSDKDVAAAAHPNTIKLAVGRNEDRIREVVIWLTDGDPGKAYVDERVPRSLLDKLYPGLKTLWSKLRPKDGA